jgi:transcriptional regulator with XRE-family HTH domain
LIDHDESQKIITLVFFIITIVMGLRASIAAVKTFSDRLRYARKLRGMTQLALARAGGLSQSAIGSYESGQRQSSRALFKLASALRVNPVWLDTGRGGMESADSYRPDASDEPSHTLMDATLNVGRGRAGSQAALAPAVLARVHTLAPKDRRLLERMILVFIEACRQERDKPLK